MPIAIASRLGSRGEIRTAGRRLTISGGRKPPAE
jgi:hypothetical protein